jgi:hypothetical protein
MAFIYQMNFVKRSYDSLVYIPVRELEPVKLYDSSSTRDRWLTSLLSRSGWFTWDITSPDSSWNISWNLAEGNPFEVETDQSSVQEVD